MNNLYNAKYFNASKSFQKNPERIKRLVEIIKRYNPKNVLDVGCGIGYLVHELNNQGIKTIGIDASEYLEKVFWKKEYFILSDAKKIPFDDKEFDLVFSSDFFEHIPEEEIDLVANEMKRVGKEIISIVAYKDKLNEKQKLYHCTNQSKDWWKDKLNNIELYE